MITVRPATAADAHYLAPRLREEDRAEGVAMFGMEPLPLLLGGVLGGRAWVGVMDDNPLGIYGVASSHVEEGVGHPWMVATPSLIKHQISFLKQSPAAVAQLQDGYHTLTNLVDERNTVHIRWLKWCGFSIVRRFPEFGFEKRPFLQFVRFSPQCAS